MHERSCNTSNVLIIHFCRRFADMDLFFRPGVTCPRCKESVLSLASSYFAGLILGGCMFYAAGGSFFSLMRAGDYSRMSIVCLLAVLFLPFLFSAFAVYIHQSWLLMPICFLKAFIFAFVYVGISVSFADTGWLVRFFLMFSDIATLPLLWLFWLYLLSDKFRFRSGTVLYIILAVAAVGCFDYTVVSSYWAQFIS